jgi:uncharacterized DUF497 family protein
MKYFDWNSLKNEKLKRERGVCFEDVVLLIEAGKLLDIVSHKNKDKSPKQNIFILKIDEYVYLVPYVEDEEKIFLKTIIPSRKATKKYLI